MKTKTIFTKKLVLALISIIFVLAISAQNTNINTFSGDGTAGFSGDGGAASAAKLHSPSSVAVDGSGNLFIADKANMRIRKVDANSHIITTVAGTGAAGFSGDAGPATSAKLNSPSSVALDNAGNLFIADEGNMRIRKVHLSSGVITTVAGRGSAGFSGDGGPAELAELNSPCGIAADHSGHLFIADKANMRVRKVDLSSGNITTIAGSGTAGFAGDGGLAIFGMLDHPSSVAVDGAGNLFIADRNNFRIRKVSAFTNVISTIAGTGLQGFLGDGLSALFCQLNSPCGLAVDAMGNLHVSDEANARIRKIDAATGIITTIAGNGTVGFSGDGGSAINAQLNGPCGVAFDAVNAAIYIADCYNERIRVIGDLSTCLPGITLHPSNVSVCEGGVAVFTVVAVGINLSYRWQVNTGGGFVNLSDNGTFLGCTTASLRIAATQAVMNNYKFRVTITNSCGSQSCNEATLTVKVKPQVSITCNTSTTICAGTLVTLTAGGASSYLWNNGSIATSITVNPSTTTTYVVTGTGFNGCTNVASITIVVKPLPLAVITASKTSICLGESVSLTASGGLSYLWSTGAAGVSISVQPSVSTTYRVTVTGSNGCVKAASIRITVNANPSVNITASASTICLGASATLTASGASSYVWSSGAIGASITVRPNITTTYIVTGTTGGCSGSASITVYVNASPSVVVIASPPSICVGTSATLIASGATSYLWSNGAVGASITVSPNVTTNYAVTGSIGGCSANATAVVSVNASPNVNISASASTICPGASSTLTASGGSSYLWSNGATTASITVSPAATTSYSVTGYSSSGCSKTASISIVVNASVNVSISASASTICAGASAMLTANGAGSYVWNTGAIGASITVHPNTTTTYFVTGTSGGCSGSASITVYVNASPSVVVIASPPSICVGTSATLIASGATSYLWSNGAVGASITVSPNVTTNYAVTGSIGGCSANATAVVSVNVSPDVNISASASTICPGASSTLTASGGSSYLWSNGATTASITVSPSATTSYSVTGYSSSGCSKTASISIVVNASVNVSISASASTICAGASATLTASGAGSYVWNNGAIGASITVHPNITTTYIVTGSTGGCSGSASVTVFVNASPSLSVIASAPSICVGGSSTLTASGATSYLWSNGAISSSITVSPNVSTNYTVTGSIGGCSANATIAVNVNASPNVNISASATTICPGASSTLTASGGSSYLWGNGATTASITVSPSATTSYSVTGYSSGGCSKTASITIFLSIAPSVTVIASQPSICVGTSTTLIASGATSYLWSNGAVGASITVSPNVTTNYTVTGSIGGCSANATAVVNVNASPNVNISASASAICPGASSTLTASGGSSYLWSNGATTASITVSPSSTASYSVTGYSSSGCSKTASITIIVNASVNVSISASASTICAGASATLTASGAGSYVWNTGAIGASITVHPNITTTYIVTGSTGGCSGSASVTVFVNTSPSLSVIASAPSICVGGSSTLTASGATSYLWSNGTISSSITVSPNVTTNYTVTGSIGGCSANATIAVNVNASPNVNISASPSTICAGASSTLTASGASNFIWSNGATTASITVSPLATSSYSVTGTNSYGCSKSANVTVFVSAALNISVSAFPSTICAGESATLTAIGATSLVWNTGQVGASITVSPNITTSYSVTGTTGACSVSAAVTVFVSAAPSVTVSASPSSICIGGSATLTASGASSYLWSNGDISTSIIVSPNATTNYIVTGSAGGCSANASVLIKVDATPNVAISASSSSICAGASSTLSASGANSYVWSNGSIGANISVSPSQTTTYTVTGTTGTCSSVASLTIIVNGSVSVGVSASPTSICAGSSSTLFASGADSYVWSNGAVGASISVNPSVTTTYSVTGTVGSCSSSAAATVYVNSNLNVAISASASSICLGGSATLTASGASNFVWSNGAIGASINVTPAVTTTYTVTGSTGACQSTASVTVFVNTSPITVIVASATSICAGSSVTLIASGGNSYLWSTGAVGASITVNPNVTTTYTVTGSVGGCSSIAAVTIFVDVAPSVTVVASPSSICAGGSATLFASGASSYVWSNGTVGSSISVNPSATTTYTVTGTNSNGCSRIANITVAVSASGPVMSITATRTSMCAGLTTTLTAHGSENCRWSNGAVAISINVNPSVTTTYTVTGTSGACTGTASVTITVNPRPNVSCVAAQTSVLLGLSTTLTASGANSYVWSTGSIGASIIVTPLLGLCTYSVTGTNSYGCTGVASVGVTGILGIGIGLKDDAAETEIGTETEEQNGNTASANDIKENINLFPNPTSGTFNLKNLPLGADIEIYNINGERLLPSINSTDENNMQVSLGDVAVGIYQIRVIDNDKLIFRGKVVVAR